MVELKREYVVPLRRKTNLAPKWRRSKKAVSVLNDFIKKHMKTDNIVICSELNEKIWKNGIKNPPGKVSVIAFKTQIAGVEKTLVNLTEVGLDKHLENYNLTTPTVKTEVASKDKQIVKDADVKEVGKEEKSSTGLNRSKPVNKKEEKSEFKSKNKSDSESESQKDGVKK